MPPKKKKEEEVKKKEKKGKKTLGGPAAADVLNEQSKEYYIKQIRDLENRIERYQQKCDALEVKNAQFREQFDQLDENKKDIVAFIKKKLDEKVDEISDLNDRLVGLQQSKDQDRESFEQQLQQLRTEFRETKDQLTSENMMLSGKLASLEEFRAQREDIVSQMTQLEGELARREAAHQEEIYALEKKQVIDKDRLKKEMVQRVNQVAAEFRKASNRQMAETTKRTVRENVAISAQLCKMSDKTMELIGGNTDLKDRERSQRQMMELYQATETELTKKNLVNQNVIRMLLDKCRQQEMALEQADSIVEQYHATAEELMDLRQQLEGARNELLVLAQQNQLLEDRLSTTQSSLRERVETRRNLEQILEGAASSLNDVLVPAANEDCSASRGDVISKRSALLENLLLLLNSAAQLGVGPAMSDFSGRPISSSTDSLGGGTLRGAAGSRDLGPGELSLGNCVPAHYKPGDLGLVPRPPPPAEDRLVTPRTAGQPAESERTSSEGKKRFRTSTHSAQTASAAKATFIGDQRTDRRTTTKISSERQSLPAIIGSSSKQLCDRVY